jgi:deoxyribodipyrimidine photo-lyase
MTAPSTDPAFRPPAIVWFREDLRLADNPALTAAVESGTSVICLFILDEDSPGLRPRGGASRWWLHGSLNSLSGDLASRGASLFLRRGPAAQVLERLAAATGSRAIFWNDRYGNAERRVDAAVRVGMEAIGINVQTFGAKLLYEPSDLRTKTGGAFRVFSPFWRAAQASSPPPAPLPAPARIPGHSAEGDRLDDWKLLPKHPDWAGGLRETWQPGEQGAWERLRAFLEGGLHGYAQGRDYPGQEATSRLSPHLAFGEIGPRQIWAEIDRPDRSFPAASVAKLRGEIGWREFAWHLLFHNPDLASRNVNASFDTFGYVEPGPELAAWHRGRTGYPLVDAAMRQLWQTGWMHNRLRLVVGSFLVKHLLLDWRLGEAWFWDTLVDADPASNAVGWQWVAGTGADAAPYFRIFNPVLQSRKFDAEGAFIRRYVPELARLSDQAIHAPWETSPMELAAAGVRLGETYPNPVIGHAMARSRALAALAANRSG